METLGRRLRDRPLVAMRSKRVPATTATDDDSPMTNAPQRTGAITGGGHVMSPAGSYVGAPTVEGTASFGFVSTCLEKTTAPHGVTEFQFAAAGLRFHSSSYQRLVISGSKAKYEGTGTLNGIEGWSFQLTATEGGEGGADTFRMKIWNTATGTQIYDSLPSAPHEPDVTTPISGGSIAVYAA